MPTISMTAAEKEQLIRIIFTSKSHTPIIDMKFAEPNFRFLLDKPFGTNFPCNDELKKKFHTWFVTHTQLCCEKEAATEIRKSSNISYEDMLLNIQIKINQTWDNLLLFCHKKLSLSNPTQQQLNNELEKLINIGELALAPYMQARNPDQSIENLSKDMEKIYQQFQSLTQKELLQRRLRDDMLTNQRFHQFIEAILKNATTNYPDATDTLNKKTIAEWIKDRIENAARLCAQQGADPYLIAKDLMADLNGSIPIINHEYQSKHKFQSFFKDESDLAKDLKGTIKQYPEFFSLELNQPPLQKPVFKERSLIDMTSTERKIPVEKIVPTSTIKRT